MLINIILFTVGLASLFINILYAVRAYQKGEYNPRIFRLRQGYEYKPMMLIAYFGMISPINFIDSKMYKGVYTICTLGILCIFINILNIKCFMKTGRKRIITETLGFDLMIIILFIFVYITMR